MYRMFWQIVPGLSTIGNVYHLWILYGVILTVCACCMEFKKCVEMKVWQMSALKNPIRWVASVVLLTHSHQHDNSLVIMMMNSEPSLLSLHPASLDSADAPRKSQPMWTMIAYKQKQQRTSFRGQAMDSSWIRGCVCQYSDYVIIAWWYAQNSYSTLMHAYTEAEDLTSENFDCVLLGCQRVVVVLNNNIVEYPKLCVSGV